MNDDYAIGKESDPSLQKMVEDAVEDEVKKQLSGILYQAKTDVAAQIAAAFAQVNIAGTNGCTVSGKFPNLTISMQISLTGSGACDDNGNLVITINGQ